MGFGVAEFFEYIFLANVPVVAAIPHIIFHGSSATMTAYGIAKKKSLPYFLIAVSLHIVNNFFALTNDLFLGLLAELLVLIAVYLLAWRYYHRASAEKMVV